MCIRDSYAPVAGVVVEVNEALEDEPESLNSAPYTSWIFKLKMEDGASLDGLLDAARYQAKLDA